MNIKAEEITQEKEESQETKTAGPQIIMTEEAQNAIHDNFSRLFVSDHDFILELGQQLPSPAEEGKNIVRINSRVAMTHQTAEQLEARLTRFVLTYKKEHERNNQKSETNKKEKQFRTTI